MRDLADDAAAEREHAGHEDDALDDGHPLAEAGQIILHRTMMTAPTTGPKIVPRPPTSVISTTSPDMENARR